MHPYSAPTLMSTIPEAGRRTGLSRSTLYRLMDRGELGYAKVGTRRLIPEAALRALVVASEVQAGEE